MSRDSTIKMRKQQQVGPRSFPGHQHPQRQTSPALCPYYLLLATGCGCHGDEKGEGLETPPPRLFFVAEQQLGVNGGILKILQAPCLPPSRNRTRPCQPCPLPAPLHLSPNGPQSPLSVPTPRDTAAQALLFPQPFPWLCLRPNIPASLRGSELCLLSSPFPDWKFLQARDCVLLMHLCEQRRQPTRGGSSQVDLHP